MALDPRRAPDVWGGKSLPDKASSHASAASLESRTLDVARRAVVRVTASKPAARRGDVGGANRTGFGFVVNENGIVLTAGRLVAGAAKVAVVLPDGRTLSADTVVIDPLNDLAVLQVSEGRLRAIPLGSSGDLRVGDPLITLFGSVGGEGVGTVRATGSANGGDLVADARPTGQPRSGLPLLNVRGEAVGIVTHTSEAGGGLSFAVPIDRAKRVLRGLGPAARVAPTLASPDGTSDR
jgi:S1-C subfamily serine protease